MYQWQVLVYIKRALQSPREYSVGAASKQKGNNRVNTVIHHSRPVAIQLLIPNGSSPLLKGLRIIDLYLLRLIHLGHVVTRQGAVSLYSRGRYVYLGPHHALWDRKQGPQRRTSVTKYKWIYSWRISAYQETLAGKPSCTNARTGYM